jgi:hypothetical protein
MPPRLLALSEIVVEQGDHTYAIDAWPMQLSLAGGVIMLALVVAVFALGRRTPPAVLAGAIGGVVLSGGLTWVVTAPGGGQGLYASTMFRRAMEAYALATTLGVSGAVAALVIALAHIEERRVLRIGFGTAAIGIALAVFSRGEAVELREIGQLPFFAVMGSNALHAGHAREAEVVLMREPVTKWRILFFPMREDGPQPYENPAAWSAPKKVHVRADAPGRVVVEAHAKRGPVRLTSKLAFEAKREQASPLLPLRVGNRWTYRVVEKEGTGLMLYVNTVGGAESEDQLEIEVVRAGERSGFRTFTLAVRGHGRDTEQEVVALEGKTLALAADGTLSAPVIEGDEGSTPFPCRVRLIGILGTCQSGGAQADELPKPPPSESRAPPRRRDAKPEPEKELVPVRFALAGPLALRERDGSAAGALGVGVLAIATLGAVILPNGSSTTYSLVETRPGPAGEPEALP